MALRVLLADESSTIKKVFQLALQDYAVEVQTVNIGLDVVSVAEKFEPDIIFADILLQKKSGYEVASELSQHEKLKNLPVVLMWSGFMALDEDKFEACGARANLEKPFDVSTLRKIVKDLVPRTQNQKISQFLSFPKMPDFEEPDTSPSAIVPLEELSSGHSPPPLQSEPEEFQQIPIREMKNRFELNENDLERPVVTYSVPKDTISPHDALIGEDTQDDFKVKTVTHQRTDPSRQPSPNKEEMIELELSDEIDEPKSQAEVPIEWTPQIEDLVQKQVQSIIESIAWKVVPELATQIIERELKRLLDEHESTSQI